MSQSDELILDQQLPTLEKEIRATVYGIVLLLLFLFIFLILPPLSDDKILNYFAKSTYGIIRLGLIFYGQTIVKKQNRNYTVWAVLTFLFTSVSLIVLGNLYKVRKTVTVIDLAPNQTNDNVNQFPDITIGTDSSLLIEAVTNDSFTLKYMLQNFGRYNKDYTSLFPVLAAYKLNERGIELEEVHKNALDKYALTKDFDSFSSLLTHISTLDPEQVNKAFS